MSLAKGLLIFLIFSKIQLLVSLNFFFCYFMYFYSVFIISFFLLTLGFACSKSDHLFKFFLISFLYMKTFYYDFTIY